MNIKQQLHKGLSSIPVSLQKQIIDHFKSLFKLTTKATPFNKHMPNKQTYKQLVLENERLLSDNEFLQAKLNARDEEIKSYKRSCESLSKQVDTLHQKLQAATAILNVVKDAALLGVAMSKPYTDNK